MNRIYRRIWNKAKQCWVVASEISAARSSGALCDRRNRLIVLMVLPLTMAIAGAVHALPLEAGIHCNQEENRLSEECRFRPLVGTVSSAGKYSYQAGNGYASGDYSVALGYNALATEFYTVALGNHSEARGFQTVALGQAARAWGVDSVAVGTGAMTPEGHSVAIGAYAKTAYIGSMAMGNRAEALRENAISIGSGSRSSTFNAIALGANSVATAAGAIALGSGSVADEIDTVSVGTRDSNRRIANVANARLSASSTDAVTGKQLYATNTRLAAVEKTADSAKTDLVAVRDLAQKATQRVDAAAPALGRGALAETGTYGASAALGDAAKAYNSGSVALGANALAGVDVDGKKIAGSNSGVSLGASSRSGNGGVAAGFRADSTGTWSVAMGADAKAQADQSTAVGYLSKATASQSTALGRGSEATAQYASALGHLSKATTVSAVALGDRAQAKHENAVALGAGSVTYSANSVSVGNASVRRKIQYIADGSISKSSTDAVTGSQLFDTQQSVAKAQTAADAAKTNADSALTKANTLFGLLNETGASGNVRLGGTNSGSVLDVRNSANASRRVTGVADAELSTTSTDAVTGRQLAATNTHVSTAQRDANEAKTAANTALTQVGTLNGLLSQASASGDVRVGGKNSGTVLDVRNSANANRKLAGVTDGEVGASSYEAVNGRQLNATNDKVAAVEGIARAAGTEAAAAKTDAANALTETAALGGLVAQVSASGNVRLGEKNSGTTLDVRNSANANRKISGVADGSIDASSTEAVSGRQLYGTNSRISALESANQYVSVGVDSFSQRAEAGLLGVAIGDSAKAGTEGGTALGALSLADGINSVAIGRGSTVSKDSLNGFAMGAGAQVEAADSIAVGAGAKVRAGATGALAIGSGAEATESDTASFGTKDSGRRLVNVARGTADHNATTVSQLNDSLASLGGSAGMDANGNIIAPTYAVQGGTQNTVEDALMALDGAVITAGRRADKVEGQLSSIFQDSPSARADGMSQIALNGVNGMVLTNLADGRVASGSRDAVTGNQLYAAEQKISQNRNDLDAMRKEREMGQQAMRGLDASVIDYGGARLTGVAEAKLSADSSDVVRGSQLYETNEKLQKLSAASRFVAVGDQGPGQAAKAGPVGVAIGDSAEASLLSEGAVAIGSYAKAAGKNSVALGRAAYVDAMAVNGFAIGVLSSVHEENGIAIGVGSTVKRGASYGVAIGVGSVADEAGTVAFGSGALQRRLVNIANGTANHNAATVGQLRGALSALGGEVDANGNIVGPRFHVQGQTQSTLNGALEALDGAVVTNTSRMNNVETQLRSVFQDTPSVRADGVNQLTLAGANGMVISNVANGLIAAGSRDAVNGGQLHSMQQQLNGRMDGLEQRIDDAPAPRALASSSVPKPQTEEASVVPEGKDSQQVASVGEGDKPTPQPKAKQDDTPKPQVDTAELEKMLARANEYTDGAISNFERRLDKMDKRFNRMAAMSSAQSAMAMNTAGLATYNRLGAGVGYSEGESAMAVGYQRVLNEKGSATFSLNGAFTNSGERSMGVGVGIGW